MNAPQIYFMRTLPVFLNDVSYRENISVGE